MDREKKDMNSKKNINPTSGKWLAEDNQYIAGYFEYSGFETLQEILDMRVFDLMNMNTLNPIRVEEIITGLYKYLNPNSAVDAAMYSGSMKQYFDYTGWRKKHKSLEKITVNDLVMAEDINLKAIQHFYDAIRKRFFKSKEYDWREYKYLNYRDYLRSTNKRGKEGGCND